MSTTFDKITIEPLDSKEQYPGWLIKIHDVLDKLQVLDIATRDEKQPDPATKNHGETAESFETRSKEVGTTILEWDRKDRKAVRAIRFHLSNELVKHFSSAVRSYDLLHDIATYYQPHGALGPVMVKRNMSQLRFSDSDDMQKHIDKLRTYAFDLLSLGHELPDEEFNSTLLLSLPESWDSVVSTLEDSILSNQSKLVSRLLSEAERRAH